MTEEMIDTGGRRGGPSVVILNSYVVNLPYNYLCLYSCVCVALSFGQKGDFLQWITVVIFILVKVPSISN